jgi:hypothetical protein
VNSTATASVKPSTLIIRKSPSMKAPKTTIMMAADFTRRTSACSTCTRRPPTPARLDAGVLRRRRRMLYDNSYAGGIVTWRTDVRAHLTPFPGEAQHLREAR